MPKALLVNNHPEMRNIPRRILERLGYQVIEMPHWEMGIKVLRPSFSVALIEISDPDSPRFEFVEKVRQQFPGMPVIVITMNPEVCQTSGERGANDCITDVFNLQAYKSSIPPPV